MSNYRKGRSAENYIKQKLKSMGFFVVRAAGSKPIDLIFSNDCCVFGAEVKAYHLSSARAELILEELGSLMENTPLVPVVIFKKGKKWVASPDIFGM
jgi:Holliday junction resolvase